MDFDDKEFAPGSEFSDVTSGEAENDVSDESGAYHGEGVGQRESTYTAPRQDDSPFASSPYQTAWEQPRQEETRYEPKYEPRYEPKSDAKPKKKKNGSLAKRILAGVAALAVVICSCGVTAALVNNRWEKELDSVNRKLEALEGKAGTTTIISGANTAAGELLSPSQVYALNVNSVVSIQNTAYQTISGWGRQYTQEVMSSGSGFIISEDGYIVTNCHVVEGSVKLVVTTYLGDEYEATLVGSDSINDVALLKVEATGLDAVEIGSSSELNVGDQVVAIGNPLGELTSTQTVGYVSGKDRSITTDGTVINMLQTDAAINSGNSGGPLFNMAGQVIGITTAKYSGDSGSGASIEGIGFAIPIDDVIYMIEDFKEYGYLKNQAYLGVGIRDLTASVVEEMNLPSSAYVNEVTEGGAAQKAGVQVTDIITGLGDHEITGYSQLVSALRKFKAGDTTTITVYRAGAELELTITFGEKPENPDATESTVPGEMPSNGSYEEWYDFFFGNGG